GVGVAIRPTYKIVVSRGSVTIVNIFKKDHAFCLEKETGAEIVVHIGIDTVNLNGQGFTLLVEEWMTEVAVQPVLELD
ncbi:PTS glucose transporter subunit IIA, partial [Yersinia pestis]|uniref:PTS glucose transporter subunit IIA n=1 Tax=Yersinia pestis TaxID=632 RepID=UPI001C48CC35